MPPIQPPGRRRYEETSAQVRECTRGSVGHFRPIADFAVAGCYSHPRHRYAMPVCREAYSAETRLGPGRAARCHLNAR